MDLGIVPDAAGLEGLEGASQTALKMASACSSPQVRKCWRLVMSFL